MTIDEIIDSDEEVTRLIALRTRRALRRHKLLGQSIAVWRDGKVVIVPPEEIVLPDVTEYPDDPPEQLADLP